LSSGGATCKIILIPFFFLDPSTPLRTGSETKNQGCKISTHRQRSIVRCQASRAAPKYKSILENV
ncbi:MAG: hypothetical protein ACXVPY_12285, partial [Bacteroidia bacterium]